MQFYVYALVDPRDKRIFYIGKGKDNRVYDHARDAVRDGNPEALKLSTIREILHEEKQVEYYVLRHNLTENEAYLVESTLIDLLGSVSQSVSEVRSLKPVDLR